MHARHDALAQPRVPLSGRTWRALDLDELPRARSRAAAVLARRPQPVRVRRCATTPRRCRRACGSAERSLARRASPRCAPRNGLPAPHDHAARHEPARRSATCSTRSASSSTTTRAGALTSVIAEVNNTYGGRLRYVLGPRAAAARSATAASGSATSRELFVSPFLHGHATYDFWFDAPLDGDELAIEMHVTRRRRATRVFTARLDGHARAADRSHARGRRAALSADDRAGDRRSSTTRR